MKEMKYTILLLLSAMSFVEAHAGLTLEQCRAMARDNYPAIKQFGIVEHSRDFTVSNAAKAYLPQVSLSARATYQSDVTKIPVEILGLNIKGLPKDQYDVSLTINQSVYDGGDVSSRKRIANAQGEVDLNKVNVTMYEINERVEQLYFGILLLDEQIRQAELLHEDLGLSLGTVNGMLRNGLASKPDVDAVEVERLKVEQSRIGMETTRSAYLKMLGIFIGRDIPDDEELAVPHDMEATVTRNNRPELALYDARERLLDERLKSLDVQLRPRVGVFLQGGYGNPALNMLKNGFDTYYKIGATLTWNFGSLYTRGNDKRKIETERRAVEADRETFLFNSDLQSRLQEGTIDGLRKQIVQDDKIIALREGIRSKSETKVANGTETVNEMLRDINAVSEARLSKAVHKIQLLQEIYKLKNINNDRQ